MTLLFVHWNEQPWFDYVLECARRRSGCDIVVVSDRSDNKGGARWYDINRTAPHSRLAVRARIAQHRNPFLADAIFRWFVIQAMLNNGIVEEPFFACPWDEVIFGSIPEGCEPHGQADYATTHTSGIPRCPLLVNNARCVQSFCDFVESCLQCHSPRLAWIQDNNVWGTMEEAHNWVVGDLSIIWKGKVFDHSIQAGAEDGYVMVDGIKKIEWWADYPSLFRKIDNDIGARTLQCSGRYKSMIPDLAKRALGI